MKRNTSGPAGGKAMLFNCFCLLGLLFFAGDVFAAIPIQEKSLQGAAAAEARLRILAAAESCLGTPYRYAGIDRRGLDCSGLVYLSFREGLNYTIPRSSSGIYNWAEKIPTSDLQIGDLVFFTTTGPGVSHLGIYAGGGIFIHSASEGPRTGVIYSRLDESYWKRTYTGAGRALPWDAGAARAMASAVAAAGAGYSAAGVNAANTGTAARPADSAPSIYSGGGRASPFAAEGPAWKEATGLYTGFGLALTWGGFIQGAPSILRGFSGMATIGYKWTRYRLGVELRPELDRALGVGRLPLTVSFGTDIWQVFAGPAYTFGEPSLSFSNRERDYAGGGSLLWEAGLSAAFPPINLGRGALSFYGELAWQPYHWESGGFSVKPDLTANMRVSTGIRFLWLMGN